MQSDAILDQSIWPRLSHFAFCKNFHASLRWPCISSSFLFRWNMSIYWFASSLWRWLCVAWSVRVAATPASAWKWGNRTMASLALKSCKLQGSFVFNIFRFECFQVDYFRRTSTAPWFRRETAAAPPTAPSSAMKTKAEPTHRPAL